MRGLRHRTGECTPDFAKERMKEGRSVFCFDLLRSSDGVGPGLLPGPVLPRRAAGSLVSLGPAGRVARRELGVVDPARLV